MSASANPLTKTLPVSNTCIFSAPTKPLRSYLSIPTKATKSNLSVSLSSVHLPFIFLQKKAFSSSIVTYVSQQGDTDTNTVIQDIESSGQQEENWDSQDLGNSVAKLSDWDVSGGEVAAEESGEEGFGVVGEGEGDDGGFAEPPEEAKIYVGNLPFDIDSERLAQIFEPAGIVEIAEVIYNRETDRSRGFGFVTMSTVEEAEKAVEMLNGYDLGGRTLTVNKAAPRGSRPERPPRTSFEPSCRVYVGNLPWEVDSSRLEQVFSDFGKVVDARVVIDRETARSRGFGFVTMSSEAEVNEAISALDGQTIDGRIVRVNVAEERPRRNF